jgi:hypothetical protein
MSDQPNCAFPMATPAHKRDRLKENLAYVAVAVVILVLLLLFFRGMPADRTASALVASIVTAALLSWKEVYGFVYGSSQGSEDKTAALAQSTPLPTTPQNSVIITPPNISLTPPVPETPPNPEG